MSQPKFEDGQKVRIATHAKFKYLRKSGDIGHVFDTLSSDNYPDSVAYEVDFDDSFGLIWEADLEEVTDAKN